MKLTFDQIKQVTFGAVGICEEDGALRFLKCTPKQTEAWYKKDPILGERSLAATGVRLDFYTNSQKLAFRVRTGKRYELYINGLLREQFHLSAEEPCVEAALTDPLGDPLQNKRVTLYFPCHDATTILESVELDDGATVTPHVYDRKFLFIGDSITQGYASDFDTLAYACRVARFFNADFVNQGIGGSYFYADAFDHIDFDPDMVFVAYGTNDYGHYKTFDELREAAHAHMKKIADEYAGKKIFYISPIWRDTYPGEKKMGTFQGCRRVLIEEAEKLGMIHVDGLTMVPPVKALYPDARLHPDDNGFSVYAENLILAIQKYL